MSEKDICVVAPSVARQQGVWRNGWQCQPSTLHFGRIEILRNVKRGNATPIINISLKDRVKRKRERAEEYTTNYKSTYRDVVGSGNEYTFQKYVYLDSVQ